MIRLIEVTKEDIRNGDRGCSSGCAIARALRREYDPTWSEDNQLDIEVELEYGEPRLWVGYKELSIDTGQYHNKFVKQFINRETPRYLLLFAVIGLKGLEWWYSDHVQNQREKVSLKIKSAPPPPRIKSLEDPDDFHLSDMIQDPTLCSLCGKVRTNPTATPGGFVFCYPCIHEQIETHGVCPITKESVGIAQLRKLYEST